MPLSDVDRQLLLIQSVGDIDPANGDPVSPTTLGSTGIVFQNIGRLWLKYARKATIDPDLRDLYVMRDAHDMVIGRLEALVDIATNNGQIDIRLSQRVKAHSDQRDALTADILRKESLQFGGAPQTARIAVSSPISPPLPGERPSTSVFGPDGNDPRYSGSPYWGRRGKR
jgi:hypothetical protein